MSLRAAFNEQVAMRVTIALTAGYVLFFAVTTQGNIADILSSEGLFAGPMIIAYAMSIVFCRAKPRIILLGFAAGYSMLSALIYLWTFSGEGDAQYQLWLLLIPAIGFPSIGALGIALGIAAAIHR